MEFHTISAYETSAEEFFGLLEAWNVDLVLDARLKNTNQLAGFTKRNDLAYFVPRIISARYEHDVQFAPAPTVMERYLHGNISWDEFAASYRADMLKRKAPERFFDLYCMHTSVALLGTATKKRRSHVEVLEELLEDALHAS